jgi:hypothetical protein
VDLSNALHPDHMTADERLDEVAEILAAGFLRWRHRQARANSKNSNDLRQVRLDFPAGQSVSNEPGRKEGAR